MNNGVASIANLATQNFSARTAEIGELQLADKKTGDKYCVWIEDGELVRAKGACSTATIENDIASTTPEAQNALNEAVEAAEDAAGFAEQTLERTQQIARQAAEASADAQEAVESLENSSEDAFTILSLSSLSTITVDYGTPLSSLTLPSDIVVTVSGASNQTLNLTWDGGTPSYDGTTAGDYIFQGTLALPNTITNPQDLKAVVTVTVSPQVVEESQPEEQAEPAIEVAPILEDVTEAISDATSSLLDGVMRLINWAVQAVTSSDLSKNIQANLMFGVEQLQAGLSSPFKNFLRIK